jgi:2-C-methyl-D-erythritol 4-phosphate cytidylyltransferase
VRLGRIPKAFLYLQARTLLERAILAVAPFSQEIIVGLRGADLELGQALVAHLHLDQPVTLLAGGSERQETVARLAARASCPLVLLHEVARPFAGPDNFAAVLAAARQHGAAALYTEVQVRDGLALMQDGAYKCALPRSQVVALQTPHAYHRAVLHDAHLRAGQAHHHEDSTVALVQWAGYSVQLLRGCVENIKITYPEDWERVMAAHGAPSSALDGPLAGGAANAAPLPTLRPRRPANTL